MSAKPERSWVWRIAAALTILVLVPVALYWGGAAAMGEWVNFEHDFEKFEQQCKSEKTVSSDECREWARQQASKNTWLAPFDW